jgi:acetolactate synthase-1/2/3 large subunit
MSKVGATKQGTTADQLLTIDKPTLNFVGLAQAMGVEASRAESSEQFNDQVKAALAKKGPHLIEVMV